MEAGADPRHLFGADGVDGLRGFLLGVHAEGAEEIRDTHQFAAGLLEAGEEIPIEGELETGVDAAGEIPGAFAPEERFLRDVVDPFEDVGIVARHDPAADVAVVFIDDNAVAVDDIDLRVSREIFGDVAEHAGADEVVGVEPSHDIIRAELGGEAGETAADGIGLAGVAGRFPSVQAGGVARDDGGTLVF